MHFFATCATGLEELLAAELTELGAARVAVAGAGVAFGGELVVAYRAVWWSRLAAHVLLRLGCFPVASDRALYAGVRDAADWREHLDPAGTLAVHASGRAPGLDHSGYVAQRTKDAICDQLRERCGRRPSVDRDHPDVLIHLRLVGGQAELSIDLGGDALHKRRYRRGQGVAPLKETVAAALLVRAGWPALSQQDGVLADPLCGAGTIPIEAALIAADIAPGLLRGGAGCERWRGHDTVVWQVLHEEAQARRTTGLARWRGRDAISGGELDPRVVAAARRAVVAAGLEGVVRIDQAELAHFRPPSAALGLVATNPPYGERLGENEAAVRGIYRALGEWLATHCARPGGGWRAAVLAGSDELGKATGWRAQRRYYLRNGPLRCTLILAELDPSNRLRERSPNAGSIAATAEANAAPVVAAAPPVEGEAALALRFQARLQQLGPWLERAGTDAYRLYDRDLPEFAFTLDRYAAWLVLQEFRPPARIDPAVAAARIAAAVRVAASTYGVALERIVVKRRERQRGRSQYEARPHSTLIEIREDPIRLQVDLTRYLDTGLFLDDRALRRRIGSAASRRRFLNLFCYSGAATVHAAAGGAVTTSVDLSPTYLAWLRRNLELNKIPVARHTMVASDAVTWLQRRQGTWDVIMLAPPTFSNSHRTPTVLDIQRDHPLLINHAMRQLATDGVLYFSTNARRFTLEQAQLEHVVLREITAETLDPDVLRQPPPHRCWELRHATS